MSAGSLYRRVTDSRIIMNAVYLIGTQGLTSLLGFAYWVVAARKLSPDALGVVAASVSLIAFLSSLATLGLGTGLVRNRAAPNYASIARGSLWAALGLTIALSTVYAGAASLLPSLGWPPLPFSPWWLVLATPPGLICGLLDAMGLAERDTRIVLVRNTAANALKLICLLAFVSTAAGAVWTTVLGLAASAVLVLWRVAALRKPLMPGPVRLPGSFIRYSIAQYLVTWVFNMPTYLFPVIVATVLGAASAGFFTVAWSTAFFLSAMGDSAGASLLAEASHDPTLINGHHRRILRFFGPLTVAGAIAGFLLGPLLVPHLFGARFSGSAITTFRLLVLGAIPYFMVTTLVSRFRVVGGSSRAFLVALLSGLVSCVGIVVLAPSVGQSAAGWSYLGANVLAAIVGIIVLPERAQLLGTLWPLHFRGIYRDGGRAQS